MTAPAAHVSGGGAFRHELGMFFGHLDKEPSMKRMSVLLFCVLLSTFCPSALRAAAGKQPVNVLDVGSFDRPNDKKDFAYGWHRPSAEVFTYQGGAENRWVRISNDDPNRAIWMSTRLKLRPEWESLNVVAKMRVENLKVGKESWHNARVVLRFEKGGKMVGGYPSQPSLKRDSDWTDVSVIIDVPKGAEYLAISPGFAFSTGTMEIDDIRVYPITADTFIDGKLPAGEKLYWCKEPVETLSSTRGRRVLNGIWRFLPARGAAAKDPKGGWGYIRVPGGWYARKWAVGKVVSRGFGGPWRNVNFQELEAGWFEREILVPRSWSGREILLNINRVCTDAVVYVDGKMCGRVDWPFGKVSLTRFVAPGKKAVLRILVVATRNAEEVKQFLDADVAITRKARLDGRGLVGDVWLESRPKGAHIDGLFVKTSVRRKQLALEVDLKDVRTPGKVDFAATVKDQTGAVVKRFAGSARVAAKPDQTVELAWKWENPKLWDFRAPNLYRLCLKARGAGLSDEFVQRFGFREFRISGKQFLLNEKVFHIRPVLCFSEKYVGGLREAVEGTIKGFMHANFNLQEMWPWDHDERGAVHFRELWAEVADEQGWPLMYPALSMATYISTWDKPAAKKTWEKRMVAEWKRYRNHPSILILVSTANRFGHRDDQNPRRIGHSKRIMGDAKWLARARSGLEAMEIIRSHDPTRPVTSHHASGVGDIHTCNNYLDFIPLQEREEWLSAWAAEGDKPYMAIEFGTPFSYNLLRGRDGAHHAPHSELLATEFCAAYLGEESYKLERKEYKNAIARHFRKGQDYDRWQGSAYLMHEAPHQKLQSLFVRNTWRSWRTWGISGGMIPWEHACGWTRNPELKHFFTPPFKPGRLGAYVKEVSPSFIYGMKGAKALEAGKALMAANSPTLAWIGGPPAAFTAKDHHFYGGERVEKQAILLNDERKALNYDAQWTVTVAGKSILIGGKKGNIAAGDAAFIPFTFKTPTVAEKTDGKIVLTARIGDAGRTDEFAFRVFPRPAELTARLLVFDPEGETAKLLHALGCRTAPWDGKPARGKVLVIGRNALSGAKTRVPGSVEAFAAAGGRVVVFSQAPEWLRQKMCLRVARVVSRRFYPVRSLADSIIIEGLDENDLRDWRGSGTLVPETLHTELDSYEKRPYGWHWGNRGSVSSAPIEKPHRSGWRPIIEGEFDLAFTPLMELAYGDGLVVWSSLDLVGRSQPDPVAGLLAKRIVEYALRAESAPRFATAHYLGGATGEKLLKLLGLVFRKTDVLPKPPALVVIGSDARVDGAALKTFLAEGGRALLLPRPAGAGPLGFKREPKDFDGSLNVPRWPECRGLSPSDLRLRAFIKAPLLVSGPGRIGADGSLGRLPHGRGVAILAQMAPDVLPYEEKTYFRYSAWRVTRTLSQILANLGGTFVMDKRSLQFEGREKSPFEPIVLDGVWKGKMEDGFPPAKSPRDPIKDVGNKGFAKGWARADLDTSDWVDVKVPGYFDETVNAWRNMDGAFWFRREITIPKEWIGKELLLSLGAVDDFDTTYFNGKKVGSIGLETPAFWSVRREYKIPASLVRPGKNTIAVRVFDHFGSGGFNAERNEMTLKVVGGPLLPDFYFPGYRMDHARGDDPYRYHRW